MQIGEDTDSPKTKKKIKPDDQGRKKKKLLGFKMPSLSKSSSSPCDVSSQNEEFSSSSPSSSSDLVSSSPSLMSDPNNKSALHKRHLLVEKAASEGVVNFEKPSSPLSTSYSSSPAQPSVSDLISQESAFDPEYIISSSSSFPKLKEEKIKSSLMDLSDHIHRAFPSSLLLFLYHLTEKRFVSLRRCQVYQLFESPERRPLDLQILFVTNENHGKVLSGDGTSRLLLHLVNTFSLESLPDLSNSSRTVCLLTPSFLQLNRFIELVTDQQSSDPFIKCPTLSPWTIEARSASTNTGQSDGSGGQAVQEKNKKDYISIAVICGQSVSDIGLFWRSVEGNLSNKTVQRSYQRKIAQFAVASMQSIIQCHTSLNMTINSRLDV